MKKQRTNHVSPDVEPAQIAFATTLVWFVRIALVVLFGAFAVYALGLVGSDADISAVPHLWHLGASEYALETGHHLGWGWLADLRQGRVIALLSLVFFPAGTLVLVAIAGALYLRERVPAHALIAFAEFVVLLVAASGVLQ